MHIPNQLNHVKYITYCCIYDKYSPFLKKYFNNNNNKPLIILYKFNAKISKRKYIAQIIVKIIEKIPTYNVLLDLVQKFLYKICSFVILKMII